MTDQDELPSLEDEALEEDDDEPEGGPLKLHPTPQTAKGNSGGTVTIRIMLINRGETTVDSPVIDVDPLPVGLTIVDRDDFQGAWRGSGQEWFWRALGAEEKVVPTLTIEIPDDTEAGEYTLSAYAHDWDGNDANGSVRIMVDPSDSKGNGKGKEDERGKGKGNGKGKGKKARDGLVSWISGTEAPGPLGFLGR